MKNYIFYISIFFVVFCFGCKKEEIITSKPGESISPVTNLTHSVAGNQLNIQWKLPSSLPSDIKSPVSVVISINVDGQNKGTVVLDNAPESYIYTPYDASKAHRFTVKVRGSVSTTDPNFSNMRYSLGETLIL